MSHAFMCVPSNDLFRDVMTQAQMDSTCAFGWGCKIWNLNKECATCLVILLYGMYAGGIIQLEITE